MKILILFAHPAYHKSKVNKLILEGLSDKEGITFHDLYQEYPEMDIDVKREQALLEAHDVVMFQFPLFWYSTPAILKEWQDMVLEHDWAFGSKGNALKNKLFLVSLSSGGPRKAYQIGGYHNNTLSILLSPLMQTASLCKMIPLPPFMINGTHAIAISEIMEHKKLLHQLLNDLLHDRFDVEKALQYEYLNDYYIKKA